MALMNSRPRSERSLRGVPKYGITWRMRALLTVLVVWLLEGTRMVYSSNSPRRQSGTRGGDLEGAVPQCQPTTYPRGLETG